MIHDALIGAAVGGGFILVHDVCATLARKSEAFNLFTYVVFGLIGAVAGIPVGWLWRLGM